MEPQTGDCLCIRLCLSICLCVCLSVWSVFIAKYLEN